MSEKTTLELEIDADPDEDGNQETGKFEISGNAQVSEQVDIDYQIGGAADTTNAIVQEYIDGKKHRRRGIYFDLGAGAHIFEIQFQGWDGSSNQWGDGSGNLPNDATGETPITQMQVFQQYLRTGTTDSLNPARLKFGQYHGSGALDDVVYVAVQGPRNVHAAEDYSTFDGTIQCFEVEKLDLAIDALERLPV